MSCHSRYTDSRKAKKNKWTSFACMFWNEPTKLPN